MATGTYLGGYGTPGFGALEQTTEKAVLFSDPSKWLFGDAIYDGAIRDAGNSPTTLIRAGLIVGKDSTSGLLSEWDADASDGTQNIAGILCEEIRAQDFNANNADRYFRTLWRGPLQASQLLIQGTAFTSHIDEHLARRFLVANGCIFDDDPFGYEAGVAPRVARVTGTT